MDDTFRVLDLNHLSEIKRLRKHLDEITAIMLALRGELVHLGHRYRVKEIERTAPARLIRIKGLIRERLSNELRGNEGSTGETRRDLETD